MQRLNPQKQMNNQVRQASITPRKMFANVCSQNKYGRVAALNTSNGNLENVVKMYKYMATHNVSLRVRDQKPRATPPHVDIGSIKFREPRTLGPLLLNFEVLRTLGQHSRSILQNVHVKSPPGNKAEQLVSYSRAHSGSRRSSSSFHLSRKHPTNCEWSEIILHVRRQRYSTRRKDNKNTKAIRNGTEPYSFRLAITPILLCP
jgi:hypothetical protein